jgi:secreted trypsin-like serine protease
VNGEPAQISEIPWTVGLVRAGFFGFGAGRKPFCGGTLINNLYVATASHCVDGMFASGIKIWLTTEDLNNGTGRVIMDVDSIRMHPGYSRRNVDNDIALIKLASPVSFDPTTSTLAPACIPANNDNDFSTYNATVAGWGTTSSGGPQSTYLRKVTVPVITNEECNRDTMYVDKISDNMLCAGFKEGGKDACQGDSGGPLTIQNSERDTLIGIVSWGYGCAGPNAPGVYTRVGRFPQWILENTSDAEWCSD